MKRLVTILLILLSASLQKTMAGECVHLKTDKDVYVAGELVMCSVWCSENETISTKSSIAYIELLDKNGLAATSKIALIEGRGAGYLDLPGNIPTGNYAITAYTSASERAECHGISVFNLTSSRRVDGGVVVSEARPAVPVGGISSPEGIDVAEEAVGGWRVLTVQNNRESDIPICLSVTEDDGLHADRFSTEIGLEPSEPEYDGEVIKARVIGPDAADIASSSLLTAIISSPGSPADTYTGRIDEDGIISFRTNNIYGRRDLVCEFVGWQDEAPDCTFVPLSPFKGVTVDGIPALEISDKLRETLLMRGASLAQGNVADADTLLEFLPIRDNLLLSKEDCKYWHFDDYTRFNTVEDIVVELLPMASIRKVRGKKVIKLSLSDTPTGKRSDNVLVLLDGVPVTDHEHLLEFDAMMLSDLYVYPYTYALGKTVFSGVMNFITARHDISALDFDENVRIIDYQGCSYPVALRMKSKRGQAGGRTLLWEPMRMLKAGETWSVKVPDTGVPFCIQVTEMNPVRPSMTNVPPAELPSMLYRGRVAKKYFQGFNGTPYLDTLSFRNGIVMYNGRLYNDVLMRLNCSENKLEVRQDMDSYPSYPDTRQLSWFSYKGRLFVNLQYQGFDVPEGFYEVIIDSRRTLFSKVNKYYRNNDTDFHNGNKIGYFDPAYKDEYMAYYEYERLWWLLEDGNLRQVKTRAAKRIIGTSGNEGHYSAGLLSWRPVNGTGSSFVEPKVLREKILRPGRLPADYFDEDIKVVYDTESGFQNAKYRNKVYEIGKGNNASEGSMALFTGHVFDDEGAALQDVLIVDNVSGVYTRSDNSGEFNLHIGMGEQSLLLTRPDKMDMTLKLIVFGDGGLNVTLHDKSTMLNEAVISSESMMQHRSAEIGVERISSAVLSKVPTVFGEKDILKVMLAMPGVQTIGEASAGFNVRGGTSGQNLILLNGNTVFYPSHFFGINSVFNPDITSEAELYKSGLPARYGGRMSSVLDVKSKDGNTEKIKGSVGVGLITSRVSLEGPLGTGNTTFILGGRATYSDWMLDLIPKDSEFSGGHAGFWDVNLGVTHKLDTVNTIKAYAYYSSDHFSLDSLNFFSYRNANGSLHWYHKGKSLNYQLSVGADHFGSDMRQRRYVFDGFNVNTSLQQYFLRADAEQDIFDRHKTEYGAEMLLYGIQSGRREPWGEASRVEPMQLPKDNAFQPSLYISDIWTPSDSISFESCVRLSSFFNGPSFHIFPEIRLSGRFSPSSTLSFKAGASTMVQYLHLITNTAAISPFDIWRLSDGNISPMHGWQGSAGVYWTTAGGKLDLSAETYYKRIRNNYDYSAGAELLMNADLYQDIVRTRQKAYGIELMAKKSTGRLSGWISYTWSRSFLQDISGKQWLVNRGNWYRSSADKPHEFQFAGNYALTRRYSFSLNVDYSTGRPVTVPVGYAQYEGGNRLVYSERNGYRVPDYFRVDVAFNIDPGHYLKALAHASFTIGCYNVTGRHNAYSVYFDAKGGRASAFGHLVSIFAVPVPYVNLNIMF